MPHWTSSAIRTAPTSCAKSRAAAINSSVMGCTPNDVDELRAIFKQLGSEICAVMLEPIQGESGVHPMTEEFMAAARDLARLMMSGSTP